jgi:hypothetical protein
MSTIALFLKYISQERLPKAFARYSEENPKVGDGSSLVGGGGGGGGGGHDATIPDYIDRAKRILVRPLVEPERITRDFDAASCDALMKELREHPPTSDPTSDHLLALLAEITARWMQKTLGEKDANGEYKGAAIAPRHVQSITYLVVAQWLSDAKIRRERGEGCRSLMGTMGTGEGKSLVFAMLACYAVKVLKMKVHILTSLASLKKRDCEDNSSFYESMGISVGQSTNSGFPDAQVVYCLSSTESPHLVHYKRTCISSNPPTDFSNILLLVDEVDSVIVCEKPFVNWVKPRGVSGEEMKIAYMKVSAPGEESRPCPPGVSESAWTKAKNAKAQDVSMINKRLDQGQWVAINEQGIPSKLHYDALDYLNVVEGRKMPDGKAFIPSGETLTYYVSSVPFTLTSYAAVVGLSGSLGGDAEKKYLKE